MLGQAVVAEARSRGWAALGLSRAQADVTDRERLLDWAETLPPGGRGQLRRLHQGRRLRDRARARLRRQRRGGRRTSAAAADRRGARLVHVSTDYVFDGAAPRALPRGRAHRRRCPSTARASSRASGAALDYERALVVRTSWLFGPGGPNFVATMVGLIEAGRLPLRVVQDQEGRPTYTPFLARALLDLAVLGATGVVHYRNREPVSWYAFAAEIARLWCGGAEVVPGHHRRVSPPGAPPGLLGPGRGALRDDRRPARGALGMGAGRDAGCLEAITRKTREESMRALITGITGFAGSHLAEYILAEQPGVEVFGTFRWRSRMDNVEHLDGRIKLVECDLRDYTSMHQALATSRPDVIFHLAAQSFVPSSWNAPNDTIVTNVTGQTNLFEAIRALKLDPVIQIACSSEEYGLVHPDEAPIKETNPLRPLSPLRRLQGRPGLPRLPVLQSYGLQGRAHPRLQPHGPRRGQVFVTSNFCSQVAAIELGLQEPVIRVGNLEAIRDFTDVRDMVRAYWLAVDQGASPARSTTSRRARASTSARCSTSCSSFSKVEVRREVDPARLRPSDVEILIGDSSKFRADTGWEPHDPVRADRPRPARLLAQDPGGAEGPDPGIGRPMHLSHHRHRRFRRLAPRPLSGRPRGARERQLPRRAPPDRRARRRGLHEVNLLDRAGLESAVRAAAPDAMVNLAGISHIGESWDWRKMPDYFWVNVVGTENVMAAAAGRPVVVVSSADVYGHVPREEQPIAEDRRIAPQTPYALTKAAAERLALGQGAIVVPLVQPRRPAAGRQFRPRLLGRRGSPPSGAASCRPCWRSATSRPGATSSTSTTAPRPTACWPRRAPGGPSTTSPAARPSRCATPCGACSPSRASKPR